MSGDLHPLDDPFSTARERAAPPRQEIIRGEAFEHRTRSTAPSMTGDEFVEFIAAGKRNPRTKI